jgi:hypothetical protein
VAEPTDITVLLPRVFLPMTGGQREYKARGNTILEALMDLANRNPALKGHLFSQAGTLRRHIICIHGDEHVKAHEVDCRNVQAGDTIRIVNSIAGG